MRLFLKIFIAVFVMFSVIVSAISYLTVSRELSVAENHIVEENIILASFLAKETEVGYLKTEWPFESLKKLSERGDFIFWWIVSEDRTIHLADNASFMGTHTNDYFPQIADVKENMSVFLNREQNYGVVAVPFEAGKKQWSLWLGFSMKQILEIQRGALFSTAMVSVLALLILGIFLYLNIVHFTKPIDELLKGTESVAKGDLDYRLSIKSKDEMGELASSFNQMTKDLKISQEQIKRHAQELEQKVQERTKDLDEKVKELTDTKTAVLNMMEDMDETNKELIETQEELKKSLRELKEMDIKKNQFISIAAHELKTPLTSIHGFSQLLQDRKVANNFTKRNKYLKIMDHETKRLAKLVSDILDLSRIDLGTVKLSLDEVDVNELVKGLEGEMDVQIKEKGLKSEYDVEKDIPRIITDREKLTEILINLIINAVKYTSEGIVNVNVFRENKKMHFVVKDTGIGIAKEKQEKIFERFYQIDSSYTRKAPGVGLGLALCKEFVELLGGKIWVESEEGKGSEFHFTLPLKGVPKKQIRKEEMKAEERLKKAEETKKRVKRLGI